ncbi:hypothetical protein CASFOL_013476 [Castilleja foliolosa]|uniref:Retrotransposon Copia-like N-terminal domain-containing protein n=1 Tax=Castilleja foliolosa TaxID=1961234 RepID=A0ABD3DLW3_9LAMI
MAEDQTATIMAKMVELLQNTLKPQNPVEENLNNSAGISLKLNNHNYVIWSNLMETFITGKRKLGFIHGQTRAPDETDPTYENWIATDAAVRSWIQNSMETKLVSNFARYGTARDLWAALATTFFDGEDMVRIYELERKIGRLRQEGMPIEDYFGELQSAWMDIDFRQPNPMECPKDIQRYSDITEKRRVLQFLMGLEDRLDPIRRDLLNAKPFPTVDQAFAAVRREYNRQTNSGSENLNGTGMLAGGKGSGNKKSSYPSLTIAAGKSGTQGRPCSHCGGEKHSVDVCWKIHGYPDWHPKNKGKASLAHGNGGKPAITASHVEPPQCSGNQFAQLGLAATTQSTPEGNRSYSKIPQHNRFEILMGIEEEFDQSSFMEDPLVQNSQSRTSFSAHLEQLSLRSRWTVF